MSNLSSADVHHLSALARLQLTEAEQTRFAEQLSSIITYVEQLAEVDTSSVQQQVSTSGLVNVLAADQARAADDLASSTAADLLAGTPSVSGSLIQVRAVLTEAS